MTHCGTYIHSTICIHLVVWHHCFLQSKHFDRRQHRFFCFFAGRRQKEQAMPSYPRLSLGSHLRPFSFVFSSSDVGFWRAGRLGCVFRRQIECGLRFAGAGGLSGRWNGSWRAEMAVVVGDIVEAISQGNLEVIFVWSVLYSAIPGFCPQCFHPLPSHQKTFLKLRICFY